MIAANGAYDYAATPPATGGGVGAAIEALACRGGVVSSKLSSAALRLIRHRDDDVAFLVIGAHAAVPVAMRPAEHANLLRGSVSLPMAAKPRSTA
jgi:hypothetical protein